MVVGLAGCPGRKSSGSAAGGNECKVNLDCGGDQFCVSGVCAKPGMAPMGSNCTATRDCGDGLYCGLLGTCAPGGTVAEGGSCTVDAGCKPGLRCDHSGFYGTCAMGGTKESGAGCNASSDCLAGLMCGEEKTCLPPLQAYKPWEGVKCTDDGAFRVYFEVPRPGAPPKDFYRLPFPNDARVGADGKLDLSDFPKPGPTPLGVDLVQLYVDTWTADFDGFSSIGVTTFRFSADIDFNTSSAANVWLIDLTAASDPKAPHLGYGRDWLFAPSETKYSCKHRMTVRNTPDTPLVPKHVYTVILTTGIKSEKGETPVVDPDMAAMLVDTPPVVNNLMHAWQQYKPLRDFLKAPGKDYATAPTADKIAAAAVFTVQDAPGHMQRVADAVAKASAPVLKDLTLCKAGVKSPCDDGTPARACGEASADFDEIHGRFSVPIFQKGTEPYETPEDGGGIVEENGVAKVDRTEDVCFALTVPKGKTAPAAGWPLMVYHHGTGGSMRSVIGDGVAAKMATGATPSATFGFDAVEHGARKGTSKKKPDDLVFNPLNPRAARDNFLQGGADVLQVFRVAGLELDAATSPTGAAVSFDATKVTYFGHSQGSTSGTLAVAFSDAAPAVIFSGAGAFLTHSLLDKTSPVNVAAGMSFLLGEPLDPEHPVLTIFQSFYDRSDPLNYNSLIIGAPPEKLSSKHVWMSYGSKDTYTPASTLNANGMSYGWLGESTGLPVVGMAPPGYSGLVIPMRPVTANVAGAGGKLVTAAVFPYDPDMYDGHFVATRNPMAIADWSAFVQSWLKDGTPKVP
jgi:hypothetical protein